MRSAEPWVVVLVAVTLFIVYSKLISRAKIE